MSTYRITRFYEGDVPNQTIRTGMSEQEAKLHCRNPESSSNTAKSHAARQHTARYGRWFDGYSEDDTIPEEV